jgi:RNA polymerase sigma-70 factor, ECF subfamily
MGPVLIGNLLAPDQERTLQLGMDGQTLVRDSDAELIDRLRNGDEAAFTELIDSYSAPLLRLALAFVQSPAVAEEVVQETWMAVVTGIGRFEGRSSVKTWLFKILTNKAKTRALRERRTIPFSAFDVDTGDEPAVDPRRFLPATHPQWPDHWASPPQPWSMGPEGAALDRETLGVLRGALEDLPRAQQLVVALRDVHGWPAADVCAALDVSEANQRVLLHRGRSRLRAVLERYFADADLESAAGCNAPSISDTNQEAQ